ncbi:hypothetical protein NKZ35_25290 [Sinorhizobium meliloti]|uniref:hypothetical protein n=1 Tax=Rhizobium meliloti TaxID=382 RepID=UPI003D64CA30
MDFTIAEGQRVLLDEYFMGGKRSDLQLPPCEDGSPCLDGRCPRCAADMEAVLQVFHRKPEVGGREWYHDAFVFENKAVAKGIKRQVSLSAGKRLLRCLSFALSESEFIFHGAVGLIVDRGRGRKVPAIEFSCTEVPSIDDRVDSIVNGFGGTISRLPFPPGVRALPFAGHDILRSNLVYGYIGRDVRKPAEASSLYARRSWAKSRRTTAFIALPTVS